MSDREGERETEGEEERERDVLATRIFLKRLFQMAHRWLRKNRAEQSTLESKDLECWRTEVNFLQLVSERSDCPGKETALDHPRRATLELSSLACLGIEEKG